MQILIAPSRHNIIRRFHQSPASGDWIFADLPASRKEVTHVMAPAITIIVSYGERYGSISKYSRWGVYRRYSRRSLVLILKATIRGFLFFGRRLPPACNVIRMIVNNEIHQTIPVNMMRGKWHINQSNKICAAGVALTASSVVTRRRASS